MKTKAFTKETCKAISADIEAALQAVAKKYGITIVPAGGRFNEGTFTKKIEMTIPEAKTKRAEGIAELVGAKSEWIGKTFKFKTSKYTVTGINPRNRTNCMEITRADGKVFKSSVDFVAQFMTA